ncbi:hypothetical protein I307_03765 [Cryptococcus deuterogattii 99/473]|uniref:Uncharacterized protein n=2 Tax=Cryptococcus deuterogattii TaxID=1859096 RepID=A0A0D0URG0_9TREE|nr:hypothetical protein I309_02602 [Cryptococcus deuterogattii LA55]KIR37786.1 hypothetical protein I313_06147 [Cryptococcus deuterogattii Ram5]KIR70211.1 hypothetical protein I310_06204 [Cryptococcus deuterogattii CA1014]KIR93792.1 hypothetical protein I304_02468 [Cryptococcus deuterogattii CBS 10090]KIS00060.1 hypothetical protein L804_02697 [Cryptococcus deuterogattii 2001/935-1]KIY56666.1 hypothetical protein I307_03765 [Cryptococcus deuterogattii 99/473]KNX50136.1 hypothetical protein CN
MPSKLHILSRRGCAYHSGDTSGKTYDSTGKVCPALTSEDRTLLAIVLSLCAFVLVVLAGIYARQYIKERIAAKGSMLSTKRPPISVMSAPLITTFDPRSTMSPSLSPYSSESDSTSSCPSSPYSDYCQSTKTFHFPLLSADGHLLPAPPASARQSVKEHFPAGDRPLPSPPQAKLDLYSFPLESPHHWTYESLPSYSSPIGDEQGIQPIGLYPGIEMEHAKTWEGNGNS